MDCFKVIFVMMLIKGLESIQNEVIAAHDVTTTTALATTNVCREESLDLIGNGCRQEENLMLDFTTDIEQIEGKNQEQDDCQQFNRIDGHSFTAHINNLFSHCVYALLVGSSNSSHYIHGHDLNSIQTECPGKEGFCITNCPVNNFTVVPTVSENPPNGYINLNLSWTKIDLFVKIVINNHNLVDRYCNFYEGHIMMNHSLLNNSLLKPNMVTMTDIKPSCQYNILIDSPTNDKMKCSYRYTVPECVGNKCDCRKYAPKPKILSLSLISDSKYLVKWDPGKWAANGRSYTTNSVDFRFNHYDLFKSAKELSYDIREQTSVISMKLLDGENYTLQGIFRNNFSCSTEYDFFFTAPTKNTYNIYNTIVIIICVVAICLVLLVKYDKVYKYVKKVRNLIKNRREQIENDQELAKLNATAFPLTINSQYMPVEIAEGLADHNEILRNQIIFIEHIGSGAFGHVYSAKALGIQGFEGYTMVAVKTLGEKEIITPEEQNDFIAEIEIFKKIGRHENIVAFLGCCTLEVPYLMIMEFVPCGDLKKYLFQLREQWLKKKRTLENRQVFFPDNSDGAYIDAPTTPSTPTTPASITSSRLPSTSETISTTVEDPITPFDDYSHTLDRALDHDELQRFALQIARGMAHLEKIGVTHRDLAARNILINESKTLKISDFGMSRTGPYINHKTKRLPLRWMAVEAIVMQKYDSKSDVWSFGVVLWEIGTLGAFPYERVLDLCLQQFLQNGGRLERPEICTDELYALMRECWAENPEDRPTFRELVEALDVNERKVYVDFSQLNPSYVFPPSDLDKCPRNPVQVVDLKLEVN